MDRVAPMTAALQQNGNHGSVGWNKRLLWALLASLLLHLVMLAIINIKRDHTPPAQPKKPPQTMDVVLFKQPQKKIIKKNSTAKTIANQSIVGASKPLQDRITRMARAPIVAPRPMPPRPPAPAPRMPPLPAPRPKKEQRSKRTPPPIIHHQVTRKQQPTPRKSKPIHKEKPALRPIPLTQLMASSLPFAQQSRHQDRARARPSLRREANIPINTREVKYAPYAHALVNALEEQWRPGQANYAQHQEQDRRVLLKLSIDRDGSLAGVEILRPSPIDKLNASAVQAIHDAAPFRPLPSAWGLDRASFFLTFEVVDDRFVFRGM
ncbi:MAG: TonB family protein [Mariprofundales bacterium]